MKVLYSILILMNVNLSFSQDNRIFENAWYLTNVVVNGVNNFPPNGTMDINFLSPTNFSARACNTMMASVVFDNNTTSFSARDYAYTLDFCSDQAAQDYQNIYFPFFLDGTNPHPETTYYFTYSISEFQGIRTLIISSMFNQQAVYSSVPLSNESFKKSDFSLFPNPAEEYVDIEINNEFADKGRLELYNELGINLKTEELNSNKIRIETKDLPRGIYFVKVKSEKAAMVKKLIKK